MIIYRVINKLNGKSYIGCSTISLSDRKHKHWLNSRDPKKNTKQAIYLAINKYGWDNFEWQELCSAITKEDLVSLEQQFIAEYDTYKNGYNLTIGGEGVLSPAKREKYIVKFPDESIHVVEGYKKFCREHKLNEGNLWTTYMPRKKTYTYAGKNGPKYYTYFMKDKTCKGYVLLGKFNDYPGTEYVSSDTEAVDPN